MPSESRKDLYEELVSNAPIGVHEISRDGRVLAINPAGVRMMAADRECDIVGGRFLDAIPEAECARVSRLIEEAFTGQEVEFESEFLTAGGTRVFQIKAVPLRDESEEVERLLCFAQDISGVRHFEQELIRTAGRLKEAQQAALIGNWELERPDGEFWGSDELYRIIGRERGSFERSDQAFLDLVHPEDRERVYQAFLSAARTGATVEIEHRILAAGGEVKWVYARGRFETSQDGSAFRGVGTTQDITARKREEQALRESEERFRLAQSAAGIGTWDMNVLTGKGTWSDNYWGIYGLRPGGCIPGYEAWLQLVHPEDRERIDREIKAALDGTAPYASEFRIIWPDGTVRWLTGKGTVVRDQSGHAVRMTGVDYDITERKQAELALHESRAALEARVRARTQELLQANAALTAEIYTRKRAEEALRRDEERFNLAVLGSRDGIWDWPDVNRDKQWWSPHAYEILGYPEGSIEASQTAFVSLLHPDDRERVVEIIERHLRGGPAIDDEYRLKTASGEYRWFHGRGQAVFDGSGKPTRMAGAITDITDRKRAEQERIALEARVLHSQKLESLGVLAGGIAHDFNNLLVGVLGNADLALMEVDGKSAAAEHLAMIVTAAKRASELTKQMLAYSGKGKFVVERVDLSQLVEEMARLMAVSISKKVKLRREFGDNIPPVEADASQIRQVVMNLITNASEAVGDANGNIIIRTGVADTGHRFHDAACGYTRSLEAPHVYIEVSDTGCGMDKQTELKLFEPFFTTKFTGRGLGLAAVLGIIRGHSGGIDVRSKPGAGSTFRVLFPAAEEEAGRRAPAAGRDQDWRGEGVVLVVDDEDTVREMAERMLARMGFEILTARDGGEAMHIIEERGSGLHLVLLDLTMPYLDGKETLREILELHPGTKVIMTSGYHEQEVSNRFEGYGVAGFLQKPYRYAELAEKVRAALSAGPEPPALSRKAAR